MIKNFWLICLVKLVVIQTAISDYEGNNGNYTVNKLSEKNEVSTSLSRRKRFIMFPEGSSFQLVFCTQQAAVIPIGDIFLYGSTLALAWALPSDPKFLYMFKEYEKSQRRNDGGIEVKSKSPHKTQFIAKPVFAKRSTDKKISFKEKLQLKIDREKMHQRLKNRNYLNPDIMDKDVKEFHRSNRLELYQKIETLYTALGGNGRQCVLYKLCEAAQRHQEQGTFLEEFLTVVFTLPKGKEFELEDHKAYDAAHTSSDDCITRYPGCVESY